MSESFIVDCYERRLYTSSYYELICQNATLKTYDNYFEVWDEDEVLLTISLQYQTINYKISKKTDGYTFMFSQYAVEFDKNSEAAANKFKQYLENKKGAASNCLGTT